MKARFCDECKHHVAEEQCENAYPDADIVWCMKARTSKTPTPNTGISDPLDLLLTKERPMNTAAKPRIYTLRSSTSEVEVA